MVANLASLIRRRVALALILLGLGLLIVRAVSSPRTNDVNQANQNHVPHAVLAVETRVNTSALPASEPCEPPCWSGITPGRSTEGQVRALVEQLPGHGVSAGLEHGKRVVLHYWNSGYTESRYRYNGIRSVDNIVERIELYFDRANYTLGNLIDIYGPPHKVRTVMYGTGVARYSLGFLYPGKGLEFWTDFGVAMEPERDAKVVSYIYYEPMTWVAYLSKWGPYCGNCSDWVGFKD